MMRLNTVQCENTMLEDVKVYSRGLLNHLQHAIQHRMVKLMSPAALNKTEYVKVI